VLYLCNQDHVDFAESFGIRAKGTFKTMPYHHPDFVKAMTEGNVGAFFEAMDNKSKRDFPEEVRMTWPALEDFEPDVIILGPLTQGLGMTYGLSHRVPIVSNVLQLVVETAEHAPMGMDGLSWEAFNLMYFNGQLELMGVIEETLKHDFTVERKIMHGLFAENHFSVGKTKSLMLAGVSPSFVTLPKDVDLNENFVFTGWMTLTSEEQQAVGRGATRSSSYFGEDRFQSLNAFLAAGERPVYLGWGSMIAVSPEHMTRIAVEALMITKKRGIILGGIAKLTEEMLKGAPNGEELIDYVQKGNVFFTDTAPHEWLFPQCSVIVHHGGSGTTAASVRSGNPTIITPIYLDQLDHARLVNAAGVGVGTQQFQKVRVSELAAAIETCMQPDTRARAKEISVKVLRENGVDVAVAELAKFMDTQVRTGEFFKVWDALAEQPSPSLSSRCFPFCQ
jgi:hypothetical protein